MKFGGMNVLEVLDKEVKVCDPDCPACKGSGEATAVAMHGAGYRSPRMFMMFAEDWEKKHPCECIRKMPKGDLWDIAEMVDQAKEQDGEVSAAAD